MKTRLPDKWIASETLEAGDLRALDACDADLRLLPSLRYAHAPPYLVRLATQHGFAVVAMARAPVREDQGEAVEGLYVILRRVAR